MLNKEKSELLQVSSEIKGGIAMIQTQLDSLVETLIKPMVLQLDTLQNHKAAAINPTRQTLPSRGWPLAPNNALTESDMLAEQAVEHFLNQVPCDSCTPSQLQKELSTFHKSLLDEFRSELSSAVQLITVCNGISCGNALNCSDEISDPVPAMGYHIGQRVALDHNPAVSHAVKQKDSSHVQGVATNSNADQIASRIPKEKRSSAPFAKFDDDTCERHANLKMEELSEEPSMEHLANDSVRTEVNSPTNQKLPSSPDDVGSQVADKISRYSETTFDGPHTDRTRGSTLSQSASRRVAFFGETNPWLKDCADLAEDVYDVSTLYEQKGCVQWLVRSEGFNNFTLLVICVNAIYMGIDANFNKSDSIVDAELEYRICENSFCFYFTLEILLRFLAFKFKRDAFKDSWFICDLLLALFMVLETWLLPILVTSKEFSVGSLKLVRLLRLARITRLLRIFPELVTMVRGLLEATRAVTSAVVMMLFMIYAFGILLLSLERDVPEMQEYFSDLPNTMWTLLLNGVLLDSVSTVVRLLVQQGQTTALLVFLTFVLISAVTIMNMLIGVLCEVVNEVKAIEKENADRSQMRETLLLMLRDLDTDGNGLISRDELLAVLQDPDALEVLANLKVDVNYFLLRQKHAFESATEEGLSISQIMGTILECRGGKPTTMQDLATTSLVASKYTANLMQEQERSLKKHIDNVFSQTLTRHKNAGVAYIMV